MEEDRKRKEVAGDKPDASKKKKKPMTLVEAVSSWVGASQERSGREEDGSPKGDSDKSVMIIQALAELKKVTEEGGKASRDATREADKMRRIEFALKNHFELETSSFSAMKATQNFNKPSHFGTNGYTGYYSLSNVPQVELNELLAAILWSFRAGTGHQVGQYLIKTKKVWPLESEIKTFRKEEIKKEWYTAFQESLSKKIHRLLGKKPRYEYHGDEDVTIHYD